MDEPIRKGAPDRIIIQALVSALGEKSSPAFLAANFPPPTGRRRTFPSLKNLSEAVLYLPDPHRTEVSRYLQEEIWPHLSRKVITGDPILNNEWFHARHHLCLSVASMERLLRCRATADLAARGILHSNSSDQDLQPLMESIYTHCSESYRTRLAGVGPLRRSPTLEDYREWIANEDQKSNDVFLADFLTRNQYFLSNLPEECIAEPMENNELLLFGFGLVIRRLLMLFDPMTKEEFIHRLPRLNTLFWGEDFLVASCDHAADPPPTLIHLAMREWPWDKTIVVKIPSAALPSVTGVPLQASERSLRSLSLTPLPLQRVSSLIHACSEPPLTRLSPPTSTYLETTFSGEQSSP